MAPFYNRESKTDSTLGDVVGPASATDNAIARFDGTTGKLIQNSAATIADTSGDITAGKYNTVVISGTSTPTLAVTGTTTVSGANTGDQTSIVGITGTKAQFNTAVSDGDILYTDAIGSTVQAYDADLTTWAGITPGTGIATALAVNVGTAGSPVINGGVLGTPSSGTVTNLTGTASININGTVGATTPTTGVFTSITSGITGSTTGTLLMKGTTSGTVTIQTAAAAGTYTLTLPTSDGDASQFLQTDGSGVLTWATSSGFSWGVSASAGSGIGITLTSTDLAGDKAFQSSVHTASGTLTACTTTQNTYSTSRTYTLTSGSVTDNFIGTLFSRTNVTTGAGGTLLAQGSVVNITGTDTQTAGTLTPSYDLLKLQPSLRSTGSALNLTVANSVVTAPTNGHMYAVLGNTQTVAQAMMTIDTGTSTQKHKGIVFIVNNDTFGDDKSGAIVINAYAGATQGVGDNVGIQMGKNFNTNSTRQWYGMYITNEQNAGTGLNRGIWVKNNSTDFSAGAGTGINIEQNGVDGTALSVITASNINASTNGLVNYTLSNSQSGATVMQKIDLGTSAQGHTGLLINAFNASTSAKGIKIDMSSTGTGNAIEIANSSGPGATTGLIKFTNRISTGTTLGYGIHFADWISSSSSSGRGISMDFLNVGAGTTYGIYQGELNRGGTTYGLYQSMITSGGSTGTSYGWYVANLQDTAETVASTSKYFSLNNAQSAVLANRSIDASEILFSRTNTATSGTKTDAFNLSYFKRTSVQNGAGGTFAVSGSVLKLENVATQTAGTLTDTVAVLSLVQDNDSTGGHILFNTYTGVPLVDGTLYFDGTNFKYRAGGVTKTITAT